MWPQALGLEQRCPASTCGQGTGGFGGSVSGARRSSSPVPLHSFSLDTPQLVSGQSCLGAGQAASTEEEVDRTSELDPLGGPSTAGRDQALGPVLLLPGRDWGDPLACHFTTPSLSLAREQASLACLPHEAVVWQTG